MIGGEKSIKDMISKGKTVEEIVDFCNYPYDLVKGIEEKLLVNNRNS
ncbi:MAG: hypothetical protein K6G03_00495 [Lachnospiraceae bacterium]|nr:hypothetical protein [Lachnospiraceae bacterium]